eukprot:TRINITY_DN3045_c0_g1_i1.p1 TRINITY_DN3045_c0_g1~~TRINITY_DN3045_c0_g1_i1.p1  ORF type:complete len:657 (-),score=135.16 TRINITY_DN3045_c0_g1_i1:11-1981(-)
MLTKVEEITPGNAQADLIDALIVGMDLLVKRGGSSAKRIFLVTNAGGEIKEEEDIKIIITQLEAKDVKLNLIGIDFLPLEGEEEPKKTSQISQSERTATKTYNEKLLRVICKKVGGVVVPAHRALEMMSYFRSMKQPKATSTFRGNFEISPVLSIPVWSYLKTAAVSLPTLSKLSKVSIDSELDGDHKAQIQHSLHSRDDPDLEIPKSEMIKGFKYGRTLVPFSEIDVEVLEYKTEACLQLIGFTDAASVPRHHYLGRTEYVVPMADPHAVMAISALVHAMAETNSVAIVRWVKRNKGSPVLGVLTPNIKIDSEFFYFNKLPFAEDIRQYMFAPLLGEGVKKEYIPNQAQLDATEDLIRAMDLEKASHNEDGEPSEALKPKHMFNPVLQYFYQTLQFMALHPERPAPPPVDPLIEEHMSPPSQILEKAENEIKNFKELFPLEISQKIQEKDNKRRFWSEAFLNDDLKLDSYVGGGSSNKKFKAGNEDLSLESIISGGVDSVGPVKPIEDFKAMFKRRDMDLVDKAITEMSALILKLVHESVQKSYYKKAIDCIECLRSGCMQEEESSQFNSFIQQVKKFFKDKRRHDFWQLLVAHRITLISYEESDDSEVSPEEAQEFLQSDTIDEEKEEEKKKTTSSSSEGDGEHDAESLFALLE